MSVSYSEDFKKEVIKTYMVGNKSTVEIAADYNITRDPISQWVKKHKEEFVYTINSTSKSNETQ